MSNIFLILLIILIMLLLVFIGVLTYFGHRFLKLKENNQVVEKPVSLLHNYKEKFREDKTDSIVDHDIIKSLRSRSTFSSLEHSHVNSHEKKNLTNKIEAQSVYCIDHPDVFSQGRCAISYEPLCENCMSKQENIFIGRKYLDLYLDNHWVELKMIREDKEMRKELIKKKRELWDQENLPVLVQGHFKINIQDDQVEEYIVVSSREEDVERVKREFKI